MDRSCGSDARATPAAADLSTDSGAPRLGRLGPGTPSDGDRPSAAHLVDRGVRKGSTWRNPSQTALRASSTRDFVTARGDFSFGRMTSLSHSQMQCLLRTRRLGRQDPEWNPSRARLHAARAPASRVRERAHRCCLCRTSRRRSTVLLSVHRSRQPHVEQDLHKHRVRTRLRLGGVRVHVSLDQSGMFPCFRFGFGSRFVSAVSSAEIKTGRVRRGSMTSSTYPRSAAVYGLAKRSL